MNVKEALARMAAGEVSPKKQRNVFPRGECPECEKKGLGNVYSAFGLDKAEPSRPVPYRQCKFCGHVAIQSKGE